MNTDRLAMLRATSKADPSSQKPIPVIWLVLAWFILLFVILVSALAQVEPVKLNGPLVEGGEILSFAISADGAKVVYLADEDIDEVDELYSVSIVGGAPTKLNEPLEGGRDVRFNGFLLSPDGTKALFVASQDSEDVFELFTVPIEGGNVEKLNDPLPAGGDIREFFFGPNMERVIYTGDQTRNGVIELYSVPASGGAVTKLNDDLVSGGQIIFDPIFSPDGGTVVYVADQDTNRVQEFYSVPAAGGIVTKLNQPLSANGDVNGSGFRIHPDGSTVLYLAAVNQLGTDELFSVPIDGGPITTLNSPLVSGGRVFRFQISPDGLRVLYVADQDTDNLLELYSVLIGGGGGVKLSDPTLGRVGPFALSADGSSVFYQASNNRTELFSVPPGGGISTKLNTPLPNRDIVSTFEISDEVRAVVYATVPDQASKDGGVATKGQPPVNALFSVPFGGGPVTTLVDGFPAGTGITRYVITPDGRAVLFLADRDTQGVSELFIVSIEGGAIQKVNPPLVSGGSVEFFDVSPDGSRIIYRADQLADGVVELFSAPRGSIGLPDPVFFDGFEEAP
ncbi:MAG: hypothetical protein AAF358_05625 [Pseudomonadota bacterium]